MFLRASLLVSCLLLASLGAARARACSCLEVDFEAARAAAVVLAEVRVLEVTDDASGELTVRVRVVQAWRGAPTEELALRTAASSAACGYSFVTGERYLLWAGGTPDALRVSLCSRTRLLASASEDLAQLGAGYSPVDVRTRESDTPRALPPSAGGCASCTAGAPVRNATSAAGAGAALVSVVVWRRRRR